MSIEKKITKALYRFFATFDLYLPQAHREEVEALIKAELERARFEKRETDSDSDKK